MHDKVFYEVCRTDNNLEALCMYFKDRIKEWFDPNNFEWKKCSHLLPKYCYNYFNIWWNPYLYN